jgi:lipopolysaccharide biosynthesis glycosyltransferase
MNIFILAQATDNNYVKHLEVLLKFLLDNNKDIGIVVEQTPTDIFICRSTFRGL